MRVFVPITLLTTVFRVKATTSCSLTGPSLKLSAPGPTELLEAALCLGYAHAGS